jgi:hypothetical protein
MNFSLLNFFKTHFPSLDLVQFSPTQFQLWDNKNIIWAKIEVNKNLENNLEKDSDTFKIISIQQKSILIADYEKLNEQEINFLEELNNLSIEFYQKTKPLLEQAKKDVAGRKKEIENQFRKGFSALQKENLQPIIQLLEEGGHSIYLLSEWISIFEFWKIIYQNLNQNSAFKKSFFQRQEIVKSLTNFYNNSHKSGIPISYSEIESFRYDFSQKNNIKESEILLYGLLNEFLNYNGNNKEENSKLDFIPIIQDKINQKQPQSNKRIWINDNQILKSLEFNNEQFKKKTLFGTFESFADLLLAFSTQNETSQFGFQAKKPISQVGIFGLSKNSELLNKLNSKLNSESNYDLIILDSDKQNLHSIKEISLFQFLSKKEKQLFASLQNAFKSLSKNGILFVLLNEKKLFENNLIEKKSLASLRRLLQEWFERIEIYESETKNENNLGILFYKKTELERGVFYSDLKQNKKSDFQINFINTFLLNTWKPKPILSEYQKLIPTIGKNAIFKTYFRAIPSQKIESFIELNSNSNNNLDNKKENNLNFKVKEFIQNHNQQIIKSEEEVKNKLEKKKTVLASKIAANTLFEKDILEKIKVKVEEKTNQKLDNKLLEFDEFNLIETQVSVFENGFWYYEKSIFSELESENKKVYDLDKAFPNRKQGENILIFWANTVNGGAIWATDKPVPPSFLNAILPNAYIFPLDIYDQIEGKTENAINKKSNFSTAMLHKFKRGYAAAFEKRSEKVEGYLQNWFDFSDFEFLQVNQELAFALQALSSIMNEDESKMAKEFRENLHNPKPNTHTQFEQIKKVFTDTKRTFERLENKATRNKESHETLQSYFNQSEKAIEHIENYWQKLEAEEAENFVVPTEENMTEELILGYIFAVWQRDIFKNKYKEELKNEIPRIPIYKDFHHLANQGNYILQKFLKESKHKIEFEIVEVFEEEKTKNEPKKSRKKSKIWFEKDGKIWFDKTTFLQPVSKNSELDYDKINQFEVNQVSFLNLTLIYLRKNKVDLQEGKTILEGVIDFVNRF